MTTQTNQQTGPTNSTQHTHHWILTLQCQNRRGAVEVGTFHAQFTPPAGWTRGEIYDALVDQMIRENDMPNPQTLYFSLEPNRL